MKMMYPRKGRELMKRVMTIKRLKTTLTKLKRKEKKKAKMKIVR